MHARTFLHKTLASVMHLKRLATLSLLVLAALTDKKISVTGLGRSLSVDAFERSNIRRSDRFIGNKLLHKEREGIYTHIVKLLVGTKKKAWIIVDWSHVPNTTNYILRAALVTSGRALTLYEEVHPKSKENNPTVHKHFLKKLKDMLPVESCPIIVTDAGFTKPWFEAVIELGWNYVGRVRGTKCFRYCGEEKWHLIKALFNEARGEEKYIGEVELTKSKSLRTHFYLMKRRKKGRVSLNKLGKKSHYKNDKEHSRAANEPWLLATSLKKGCSTKKLVFKIYASRMQIEEGFRDLKSSHYGFSFEKAHSKQIARIEILLLIAMLASLVAWLTGYVLETKKWHYQFQANSIKDKRVLSLFFLGCQAIRKKINIPINMLYDAIQRGTRVTSCVH